MNGSYQFENLEGRHTEAGLLAERASLRLEGFIDLIHRHGIKPNGKILEVGCGQGIRTRLMAQHLPQAQVMGIDRSDELLEKARTFQNPLNLSFQQANLYELPFPDHTFDFIYARLVFMHLTDPVTALQSLRRVLKPGGRILIEDADRDCMFFEPAPLSFADFWQKVQNGQRRLGGDPNVGRKLAPYLKTLGFTKVQTETQPILGGGAEIDFLVRTLMPSLNTYLDVVDRPGGEAAIADLAQLVQNPSASFYHFWFVVSGEKK